MSNERITAFAKQQGYDDALYIGKWHGFEVYEPVFSGDDVAFVGLPLVVLANGEAVRMSTVDEALEQLNDSRKEQIFHLLMSVDDDLIRRYFDPDSDKLLDEKIEVLTFLKEGKTISEIPKYYDILELLPKEGVWD